MTDSIPQTIHRIWLDDPMPDEFFDYGEEWKYLHPGWIYWEWRDSKLLPKLINQELFDQAREIIPDDWKRFQADLLRLELLWIYGGIYVDTDVQPLKSFYPLLDHLHGGVLVAFSPNRAAGGNRVLTQAVLGATKGHPFIKACIDAIPESVKRYQGQPLAKMIGPYLIDRVHRENPHGVYPMNPDIFYPQSNRDRDRGRFPNLGHSYAWHRWANTRDNRKGGVE